MLSEALTVQMALDGSNLARFGDGEFKLALGADAKSQERHPDLQAALRRILTEPRAGVLACIPNIWGPEKSPKESFWSAYRGDKYIRLFNPSRTYGSAFISRPDSSPAPFNEGYWRAVKRLWWARDVVVVGGSHKSLKAGDLEDALSVAEVDCPRQHAWSAHDELLDRLKGERRRVLLCCGATATVLAWELAAFGVHAIDLGHLGMFLRKARVGEPLVVTDEDRATP